MSTAVKAIIIIFICVSVLVLTAVGAGIYWWSRHKDEIVKGVTKDFEEGTQFGKTTTNQGCLDEALSRHKKEHGFSTSIAQSLFVRACLEASQPSTGFCDGVPRRSEFIRSAQWQVKRCKEAGLTDQYCSQIFSQVQEYCDDSKRKSKQ